MHAQAIPGPRTYLPLGHASELGRDALAFLERLRRSYGSVVRFRLGAQAVILVTDPEDLERVFLADADAFRKPPMLTRLGAPFFGAALTATDGDLWRRRRRLAAPAFATRQADSHAPGIVEDTAAGIADWADTVVGDVETASRALVIRSLARLLLSTELAPRDAGELGALVHHVMRATSRRMRRGLPIPLWLPTRENRSIRTGMQALHERVQRMIRERASHGGADLYAMLVASRDELGGLKDRELLDEITIFLALGGHQTALALVWTLEAVAHAPEIQAQLSEEARARLPSAAAASGWRDLTYSRRVVLESLRMRPPFYVLVRQAMRNVRLQRHTLPAGALVMLSPWLTHRDPRFFPDPEAFRPDRWTDDAARDLPRYAYLPFGGGPRVCISQGLTTMHLVLMLSTIARDLRVEASDDTRVAPRAELSLGLSRPLALRIGRRPPLRSAPEHGTSVVNAARY